MNEDGSVSLSLVITPNRNLSKIELSTDKSIEITQASINETPFDVARTWPRKGFFLRYVITGNEPIKLQMTYQDDKQAKLRIVEFSDDFIDRYPNVQKRAKHIMPTPFRPSDMLITSQLVSYDK